MESLDAKKVRLLGRWLKSTENRPRANYLTEGQFMSMATEIINLLYEIEQAYHTSKEIAHAETQAYERYPDAD